MVDIIMYYVYLLKSERYNWHYVGFTSCVVNRLNEHNLGQVKSSKHYKPFELKFVQVVDSRIFARNLERYLKVRFNKESLLQLL